MPWRKWFVRGLVFSIIGACIVVALIYQRWTDPAAVREIVIAKLQDMYPGAVITVDSARLRILGGIQVNELRMSRRDDPDRTEFFHVPSAVIYHDKEKISQGQLTLRKIELNRPRLRAVRLRSGKWNLQGIIGKRPSNAAMPTVVMHHGTVLIEDQQSALPNTPIEINDVDLSFINDPLNIVTMVGSASSSVLGSLQIKGIAERVTKELSLKVKTTGATLGAALMAHLTCECPKLADLTVEAKFDLEAGLTFRLDQKEVLADYNVSLNVTEGKLRHTSLPLPLDEIRCTLECTNGAVEIGAFEACSGKALLKGRASTQLPSPEQSFQAELEVQHLNVSGDLAAKVSAKVHHLQQLFQATGPTTLRIACARRDGKWVNLRNGAESRFTLLPEGARVCFKHFQFPLEKIADGYVEWRPASATTNVNVIAYARERPVTIEGSWTGHGDQVNSSFNISAEDVALEPALIGALSDKLKKLIHSFHPSGKIGLRAHLQRVAGSPDFRHEYHIKLHDGTVCWKEFPYPLEKVHGFLDVYPGQWIFHDGYGEHRGGAVWIEGCSLPGEKGDDGLDLKIWGRALGLEDMRAALVPMPQMGKAWDSFRPRGKLDFDALVNVPPGRPQDLDVRITNLRGGAIEPQFFPYLLGDITGKFRYYKNRLEAFEVQARHNDTRLLMNHATVDLRPGGGHATHLHDLHIRRLWADEPLLQALPKPLRSFVGSLQLSKPVDIDLPGPPDGTRPQEPGLRIYQDSAPGSQPWVGWDGQMAVRDAQLSAGITLNNVDGVVACRGWHDGHTLKGVKGNLQFNQATFFKQRFQGVHGDFLIHQDFPDQLNMHVVAPIFGGDLIGQVHVNLTSDMLYTVKLNAANIDLQQFGAHNLGQNSQLEGKMEGQMYLWGLGTSADTLDGHGVLRVHHGRLYNLPLLLDLIKFLASLHWPDHTAFEDVFAQFSIHGNRARVDRLDLKGNAISLLGQGDFNLDGTGLNLDFYPSWGHINDVKWLNWLTSPISKNILVIQMRGQVDSNPDHLKFNKSFVPAISAPLRELQKNWENK